MNLKLLEKEIDYQFKPQQCNQYGATIVAYIDSRDVQNILDEAVGKENWQDSYSIIGTNLYCTLSIKVNDEWVGKTDCGTESSFEKEKGQASDAFKRAAVKWGIGRYLYDLPELKTKSVEYKGKWYPADDNGRAMGKAQLHSYCHKKIKEAQNG